MKKTKSTGRGKQPAPLSAPQIAVGYHNEQFLSRPEYQSIQGNSYKDRSTVCFMPTLSMMPAKVAMSHEGIMKSMNQKFAKIPLIGMEVGEAYETMVNILRTNPELRKWKYVLTLENDNIVPPDGLLKLQEDMEDGRWDAIGALYWTKGHGGKPMCYGRADVMPRDFIPWVPPPDSVVQCNGLGMGCTIFKMGMLLDERFERPLFKTQQEYSPQTGVKAYTQDLRFFENAGKLGYRVACSTRVLVGHYDVNEDMVW